MTLESTSAILSRLGSTERDNLVPENNAPVPAEQLAPQLKPGFAAAITHALTSSSNLNPTPQS